METNIGIDFGSTYSMFSSYTKSSDAVSGIQAENGNVYIPSVACKDEFGDLQLGEEARNVMRSVPDLSPYRAFKMLLHEEDQEKILKYGYHDISPKSVASEFLTKYLKICAEELGVSQFDNAVICVPEHWTKGYVTMSGRSRLLNICKKIQGEEGAPLLKKIRVVTEPVAATAYYVHNYKKVNGTPYEGDVIVVDYGGGTLDVTLTTVRAHDGKQGSGMEIDAFYRTGVGENHKEGQIGDGGLAYMEEVTRRALKAAGFGDPKMDGIFLRAKDDLESKLISGTRKLHNRIQQRYRLSLEKLKEDHEVFDTIPYKGKKVEVTYSLLYAVFRDLIQPKLVKCLKEVQEKLDGRTKLTNNKVKLAIVGGFGQFPLVQKAVWQFFDNRNTVLDITQGAQGGRQDAISFGAALIAAGQISVRLTAKHSIGLRTFRNGMPTFRFALKCGQTVECNKVYPLGGAWGDPLVYDGSSEDPELAPWVFAVNDDPKDFKYAIKLVPMKKVSKELADDVENQMGLFWKEMRNQGCPVGSKAYFFGFSMNESELYTLHIFAKDPVTRKRVEKAIIQRDLGDFPAIFGPNVEYGFGKDNKNRLEYIE